MSACLQVFARLDAVQRAAAEDFRAAVAQAVQLRGAAHIALSGGSTPLGMFALLAESPYQDAIPWADVHVYWADERCVPPDDPQSNYGQAWQVLLQHVPVNPLHIHRIQGELDPQIGVDAYAAELARQAPPGQVFPCLDWVLLGMGADGHTASLFPGQVNPHEADQPVIVVTAEYQGRPAQRITLTPLVLNAARALVFLVAGREKAGALADVLNGPRDELKLPAQRIHPPDGTVTWMVDSAAAGV